MNQYPSISYSLRRLFNNRLLRLFLFTVIVHSSLSIVSSFGQEPAWGTQAKRDSVEARRQRAFKQLEDALDPWLITDHFTFGVPVFQLIRTSDFPGTTTSNPGLGAYLADFEKETGATVILRAYIETDYFNPWVKAIKRAQQPCKLAELQRAGPAHLMLDIVYTPSGMLNRYDVAGYNIQFRDSLRTEAFNKIFSEADFARMRDTLQAAMGVGPIKKIDSVNFNAHIIGALEALKGNPDTKPDPGYKVTFRQGNAHAIDAYRYPALRNHYKTDAAGHPVPWLAVDARKPLTLAGRYEAADSEAAKETPLNIEAADLAAGAPEIKDTAVTQQLLPAGSAREITAEANYFRTNRFGKGVATVAGQIGIAAYEPQQMKLTVVLPQGENFAGGELEKHLNEVYGQAVVTWAVQAQAFDYAFPAEIQTGNALLSSYSKDMNAVIKAFKKANKVDKDTYYIFPVPRIAGDATGYMPVKGQFGFVENAPDVSRTIAHELGHGAFRLWHTFSEKGFVAAQGATDNLMDYGRGAKLYKHQWDLVHDPETVLMPFLVDEEEEMAVGEKSEQKQPDPDISGLKIIAAPHAAGIYLTPAGNPIGLPDVHKIEILAPSQAGGVVTGYPHEAVYGFYKYENGNEERYFSDIRNGQFLGYYKTSDSSFYYRNTTLKIFYGDGELNKVRACSLFLVTDQGAIEAREVSKWWRYRESWAGYQGEGPLMKGSPDCGCEAALQQYENSPLMRNRAIGDAVKKDPCILNTLHPFNNSQLVFKSQWMKDFEEVFGALLNVALFPAVCEIVVVPALEMIVPAAIEEGSTIVAYMTRKKAADMMTGMMIDIGLQAFMLMYFDDVLPGELHSRIDYRQATATGIEVVMGSIVLSAIALPAYSAMIRDGRLREDLSIETVFNDAWKQSIITVLVYYATNNSGKIAAPVRNAFTNEGCLPDVKTRVQGETGKTGVWRWGCWHNLQIFR